jgi:hypothetical protein
MSTRCELSIESLKAAHAELSNGVAWPDVVAKYGASQSTLRTRFGEAGMKTNIQPSGKPKPNRAPEEAEMIEASTGWAANLSNQYLRVSL